MPSWCSPNAVLAHRRGHRLAEPIARIEAKATLFELSDFFAADRRVPGTSLMRAAKGGVLFGCRRALKPSSWVVEGP
jgi:hypothetical protein